MRAWLVRARVNTRSEPQEVWKCSLLQDMVGLLQALLDSTEELLREICR